MASAVHAVALRSKQAKKKKLLQDQALQQLVGDRNSSIPTPSAGPASSRAAAGRASGLEPIRSPAGWDLGSDQTAEGTKTINEDHRERAEKAHKKWLKKHKAGQRVPIDFSESYAAAEERGAVDLLLWLGLAVLLTGTVVGFVGSGEKGFRTSHLRLLGPIMAGSGLAVVIIRVALCCRRAKKTSVPFKLGDQLAKTIRGAQCGMGAVQAVQYQPVSPGIPAIQVDPAIVPSSSSNVAMETTPDVSPSCGEEDEPLIPARIITTAVTIENEETKRTTNWSQQADQLAAELSLSPLWLAGSSASEPAGPV